jgi:hypothetical protein
MGINTLSDSIGQSGGAIEWVCSKGNKYKISLLTLEKQSELERAFEKRSIEKIKELKDILDKEDYSVQITEAINSIKNGDFVFGGKRSSEILRTLWGISAMLSILAGITINEAGVLINENDEISQLIEMVVERSFPAAVGKAKAGEKKV